MRQIGAQLRGIRERQDRWPVVADAFQQVDDAGRVHRQMGGRAIDRLLADDVQRLAGAVRDSRREGQCPLRGDMRLMRAGLDLDASSVPDDGGVTCDAFLQAERHGGTARDSIEVLVPLWGVIGKRLRGGVDVLPAQRLGQGRRPQGFGARARPRGVAACDYRRDVGEVGQLDRARVRQNSAAGDTRQRGGAPIPEDVGGVRGTHAAQTQPNVHVCAHLCAHRSRGALGGRDEMQTEAASLRGESEQDLHRIGVRLGENAKLVDRDNETRWGRGHAARILFVSALPRGEVREAERPERLLASLEYRRDSVQRSGRGAGVKVGEECLGVGERLEAGESCPALVVDEDETDLFGAVAVRDSGKPPEERLGLSRSGAPCDEGVRPVGDQVQVDGSLL